MKLTTLILLLALATASATTFGQKITLSEKNATLKQLITKIRVQSGYGFLYTDDMFANTKPIKVELKGVSLEEALDIIFKNQPLDYTIEQKNVIIKVKPPTFLERVVATLAYIDIRGRVTDENNNPLPGAIIKVKGTNRSTSTNDKGEFFMGNVDEKAVLIIAYMGYEAREISAAKDLGTVSLKLANNALEEVNVTVNTGYQTLSKERATGSFSQVSNELFNRQVSGDVLSRLNGIVPSLLFNQKSGQTRLTIRGRSTIFANDEPLIVVDNFPYEGDLNSINPNDVENIAILKDAAAASIWGVRAGNGVIVITTKKGKLNEGTNITINSSINMIGRQDLYYQPIMSTRDYIDVEEFLFKKGKYDDDLNNTTTRPPLSPVIELLAKARQIGTPDIINETRKQINALRKLDVRNDLNKYFYRTGNNQQYAVNVKGGGERYTYYFSSGFDKNIFNKIGNDENRITLNANNSFKPIKNLVIDINLIHTQSTSSVNNTVEDITSTTQGTMIPYTMLADDHGNPLQIVKDYRMSFVDNASSLGLLDWHYKPLEELGLVDNGKKNTSTRINSNIRLDIFSGLSAELKYQYQTEALEFKTIQRQDSYYTRNLINSYSEFQNNSIKRNIPLGDILSKTNSSLKSENGRFQIDYNKRFGKHQVNAIVGYEQRQVIYEGFGSKFYGYDQNTANYANVDLTKVIGLFPSGYSSVIPGNGEINWTVDRFRSYFSNASYTFNEKYTMSGSARRDESNLFGVNANKKGVPLWSTGFLWKVDKETFYSAAFPELKIRMTYGENGNFDNTVTAYTTARSGVNNYFTGLPNAYLENPSNSNLQWETIKILNIGLDFINRAKTVSGSLDYYRKKGNNLIGIGPINATTGLTTFKGNIAETEGSGLDVNIQTSNINRGIKWKTNFILSYETNKVTKYSLKANPTNLFIDASSTTDGGITYSPIVGKPLFSIYSYKWAGLSSNGDPQGYFNGLKTTNYDNLLSTQPDSILYNGRATPPVYGSIRNTIEYKFLTFSFNITYKFGYYFRRKSIDYSGLVGSGIGHSDYDLRWQNPGDEVKTNVPAFIYPTISNRDVFYSNSSVLVEKGDHIRLQDIQLSADIKQIFGNKMKITGLQFYIYANNLGIIWRANKQHLDPDYGLFIPPSKSIAFGLKANL